MKFEDMKVGVIGVGYWGIKHVEEFKEIGVDVTAVDIDKKRLELCKNKYWVKVTPNLEEILQNPEINAVTIGTPNQTHFEIAKKCLDHGKNVLVEKPLALSIKDAQRLVDLAKDNGCILTVGHIFRLNNAINRIREMIFNKELGNIRIVKLKWTNMEKLFKDRDVIFDLAPHAFDIINYLFGRDPDNISCVGNAYRRSKDPEAVFINGMIDNIIFNIELSWLTPPKTREIVIVGSEKSLIVNAIAQTIEVVEKDGKKYNMEIVPNNTIRAELEAFLRYSDNLSAISPAHGEIGVRNIKMIELTQKALKEKRTLKLGWK